MNNVVAMLQIITQKYLADNPRIISPSKLATIKSLPIPELEITPDTGLLHPLLLNKDGGTTYASNPKGCKFFYICILQHY